MLSINCHNCLTEIEVVKGLTKCPECLVDVRRQVATARQKALDSTVVPEEPNTDPENDNSTSDPTQPTADEPSASDAAATEKDPEFEFTPPAESTNPTLIVPDSDLVDGLKKKPESLGSSESTLRGGDSVSDPQATLIPEQIPLDPRATLIAPQPAEAPATVVNPAAAQEAAEIYSQGLNTAIPPRSVSRVDTPNQIQDYKVEEKLGAGAFGVVFSALQVPLDRSVAVKVLTDTDDAPPERRLRMKNEFLREAQFTGRLEHPNIVPVHDIGLTVNADGHANPFYVMKQIRGKSWLETIRSNSRQDNLKIFKSVINAIAFSHDQNIVHCDLKPDNVMVGEFGEVLVVDWGQAIDLSNPDTIRPGGTPAYISPEMARYWCDLHLEHKPESPARDEVGFRSDVYLLGALLFEIVTKSPPHVGEENDSAYQIIRKAAKNEVFDYQRHTDDELMHIALAALRLGNREPIETIDGLSEAVRLYEDRLSSIELRHRAQKILKSAKANSDYDEFQRARFGFEESIEKWEGNKLSRDGLRDARLSCAELALKDQNFDLGIGMLEAPETAEEKSVREQLVLGKTKRDRRKKLVRYLALGLISSIIVGLALNAFVFRENYKLLKLRDAAVDEKQEAETSARLAEEKRQKAEQELLPLQKEIEDFPIKIKQYETQLAEKKRVHDQQKRENDRQKRENDQQKKEFDQQTKEYNQQKNEFDQQTKEHNQQLADQKLKLDRQNAETRKLAKQKNMLFEQVSNLNESSKLLRYKSGITNVVQKLQAGDYRETRKLLDVFEDQSDWEVARLNLLAHREIEAIYPDQALETFAASADGSRFAMVFDQRVEIRDTNQFNRELPSIQIQGATAVALSADGTRLAIGKPSGSKLEPGKIWIFNISNPGSPSRERILDGQSMSISKLEFGRDSKRFLSVGLPSKIRKSSGTLMEKELMVWDSDWAAIDVELIGPNGELPIFSSAAFSRSGDRVLTTNPLGLPRDQHVHVLERRGSTYRWLSRSPEAGINVATFENPTGTRIVGCQRDLQAGTYSLATWPTNRSDSSSSSSSGSSSGSLTGFVSTSPSEPKRLRTVATLEQKALSINKFDDQLVTSGQDRQITVWDWQTKTASSYGGHAHDVNFTALLKGDKSSQNIWISVAAGDKPEILKTDLSKFRSEVDKVPMGRIAPNQQPSPSTLGFSNVTQQAALGNNLGQASVTRNVGKNNSQTIQWNVSAWKNHVLSTKYLFAQSRSDFIYKFNRETGALDEVLTKISSAFDNEIIKFEVSQDSRIALVVTKDAKPEFHLWDLEEDSKIRTVDYGAQNVFGTGSGKELLAFRLSPDGQFVIGGKVGLFAWSTQTGERRQLTNPGPETARSPVSSIEFLNQSSRFLASWKDRIDRFDLRGSGSSQRFNTRDVAYNKNEPNLFGAIEVGGRTLVLVRSIAKSGRNSGINLIDLESQRKIATFESARFASFSQARTGDVIVVSDLKQPNTKPESAIVIDKASTGSIIQKWNAATRRLEPIRISDLSNNFDGRFSTIQKAFLANDKITLQVSSRSRNNSTRRDWNTISIDTDKTIGTLRVLAQPELDFHATAGDRAITLDSGTVRFWKLNQNSVQPDGVLPGFYRSCTLSKDEKTLIVVANESKIAVAVDPQTGQERYRIQADSDSNILTADLNVDASQIAIGLESGDLEIWQVSPDGETKLQDQHTVAELPIEHVCFANNSKALLAVVPKNGMAFVVQKNQDQWQVVGLGHIDGPKITAADISPDGNRVISGSQSGRLTIWNSEVSKVEQSAKPSERNEERELYSLQNKHQSEISFVKFVPDSSGELSIFSADASSGENSYLIWNSKLSRDKP